MSKVRKIVTAGGTFAVALGIGFVMQNGDALAERFGGTEAEALPAPTTASLAGTPAVPQTPDLPAEVVEEVVPVAMTETPDFADPMTRAVTTAALNTGRTITNTMSVVVRFLPDGSRQAALEPAAETVTLANATEPEPDTQDIQPTEELVAEPVTPDCTITLAAEPGPAATVALKLSAPCQVNARAVIHHQGIMVTTVTDDTGLAALSLPALAETATYIAAFANDEGAVAEVSVPDVADYHRAVVQWQGDAGFELHARENDAAYGTEGHVWAGAPQDVSDTEGFLLALGDDATDTPFRAEVFTYPAASDEDVMLSVEAEVSAANCGRDVAAQSLQMPAGGTLSAVDLELTMPDCASVGDFLVLDTMLEDLTIAGR